MINISCVHQTCSTEPLFTSRKNKLYFKPHSVSAKETITQISITLSDKNTKLNFHYHQSYDAIPSETG